MAGLSPLAWPLLLARRTMGSASSNSWLHHAEHHAHPYLDCCFSVGDVSCYACHKVSPTGPSTEKARAQETPGISRDITGFFDDRLQHRWVRKDDGVVLVDEVIEDRRLNLGSGVARFCSMGRLWIWEIAAIFQNQSLQSPYMFLFFIFVVSPSPCICSFDGEIRRSAPHVSGRFGDQQNKFAEIPVSHALDYRDSRAPPMNSSTAFKIRSSLVPLDCE